MREKLPIAPFVLAMLLLVSPVLQAQVPLNPQKIPQFVDPLPHFAGLRLDAKAGGNLTVRMKPTQQIAVSTGTKLAGGVVTGVGPIGMANLWAYELSYGATTKPVHWPAFTIEAQRNNPLYVTYVNDLVGETYANVGLVVDQTLHWANPNNLPMMDPLTFSPYLGEPPAVVHLHGGEVPPLSDGGPDSWFTPGYSKTGHAFNGTHAMGGAAGVPAPYFYPNTQEPATIWFHDHALGATRLNVYAGMAGFYLLRGADEDLLGLPGFAGDDKVQEVPPAGASGVFNPAPYLPEIEVAIQDRMFDTNGKLFFPSVGLNPEHPFWVPEFVGDVITVNGKTWPYLSVAPRKYRFHILNGSNARFYNLSFPKGGPTITQVGTDGGFLDAPVPLGNGPLLLAPGERAVVVIDFTAFAKPAGFKGNWKPKSFILGNDARTPFPGGATVQGNTTGRIMQFVVNGLMVDGPDADGVAGDPSVIPANLRPGNALVKLTDFAGGQGLNITVAKKRQLTLNEVMGAGGPLEVLVNNTKWNGLSFGTTPRGDFQPLTPGGGMHDLYFSETIDEGTTEIWRIINLTADAHPIHLHLVQFQLMSRQPFNVAGYTAAYDGSFPGGGIDPMTGLAYPAGVFMGGYGPPLNYNVVNGDNAIGGNPAITPHLIGAQLPANLNERGWKDTFIMYPGEVTTVIARWAPTDKAANTPAGNLYFEFDPSGGHGYVWHCHIIDHEDNEMMRPYRVTPNPAAPSGRFSGSIVMAGNVARSEAADEDQSARPAAFELAQNYPNPFNPSTEIRFALPEDARVVLTLYNSLGQEIQRLLDADAPAGNHTVKLDASRLSSGTYFYRIQAGSHTAMKKMMLIK